MADAQPLVASAVDLSKRWDPEDQRVWAAGGSRLAFRTLCWIGGGMGASREFR